MNGRRRGSSCRGRWRVTALIITVGFQAACAPVERVEWDVQRGRLVDQEAGYFSYYDGVGQSDPQDVCLRIADRHQLEGRVLVKRQDGRIDVFHPAVPYADDVSLIPPSSVAELSGDCAQTDGHDAGVLEIGYFAKTIYGEDLFRSVETDSSTVRGVAWKRLTADGRQDLAEVLEDMRSRAAEEGAMEVRGVAVSCSGGGSVVADRESKQEALTVIGRAVVIGEVEESRAIRPLMRVPVQ